MDSLKAGTLFLCLTKRQRKTRPATPEGKQMPKAMASDIHMKMVNTSGSCPCSRSSPLRKEKRMPMKVKRKSPATLGQNRKCDSFPYRCTFLSLSSIP